MSSGAHKLHLDCARDCGGSVGLGAPPTRYKTPFGQRTSAKNPTGHVHRRTVFAAPYIVLFDDGFPWTQMHILQRRQKQQSCGSPVPPLPPRFLSHTLMELSGPQLRMGKL